MDMKQLASEIIEGRRLTRADDLSFFKDVDLDELAAGAEAIREALCSNHVDLCTIINGRAGRCSENCKFCAQSAHNHTGCDVHGMLEPDVVVKTYELLHEECKHVRLCASHGLLSAEAFARLKAAGVEMYHENIETSQRNFPNICTTHTYEDKIREIRMAKEAGLMVCSGVNATITGDMFTTVGNNTKQDIEMLTEMGFDISQRA